MIITIASGKGGTGKTTVAVNLAYTLAHQGETVRLLDCDVEEPNDHLFVRPDFQTETDVTVMKPVWNADPCTACGKCVEACQYNAMALVKGKILIFQELCHACGVCSHVCPVDALTETPSPIGKVRTATGPQPFLFADGVLNLGEALAHNIVR
jgi:MinD superfamily P-loop ATPase